MSEFFHIIGVISELIIGATFHLSRGLHRSFLYKRDYLYTFWFQRGKWDSWQRVGGTLCVHISVV